MIKECHHHFVVWKSIGKLIFRIFEKLISFEPWRWKDIFQAIVQIGIESLPIVTFSTVIMGIVVTKSIAWHLDLALHTVNMMPGFIGQFILRELGVAIPSFLMVAKVGAAITAEIGSMKVTEQIDALKLLGIDPFNYLVFPKFIATIISSLCLTIIAITVTTACSLALAIGRYNFSFLEFINGLRHFVGTKDIICASVKGILYGSVIPLVSCSYGFHCESGAEGVGTATTQSVVASTVTIILLDFVLTYLFTFFL